MIRASDGLQQLPGSAQALWSSWLIGCVVVYGLLPRLVCLAVSLYLTKTRLAGLTLDTGLPGYAELRDRLAPVSENTGRSEEHTSELQSLMRISYAVFCLKKKKLIRTNATNDVQHVIK